MTTKYGWIALGIFCMSTAAFAQQQQETRDPHLSMKRLRQCEKIEKTPEASRLQALPDSTPEKEVDAAYALYLSHLPSDCAAEVEYQMTHIYPLRNWNDETSTTGQGQSSLQSATGNRTSSTSQTVNRSPAVLGQAKPASQGAAPANGSCGPDAKATCVLDHEAEPN